MRVSSQSNVDPNIVLGKAVLNAGKAFGLKQDELRDVIGKDRSAISRNGIDPESKPGEMALMLVRCYRSLSALMGGDAENIKHWFNTPNRHLGNKRPIETIKAVDGLVMVTRYLGSFPYRLTR